MSPIRGERTSGRMAHFIFGYVVLSLRSKLLESGFPSEGFVLCLWRAARRARRPRCRTV